MYRYVDGLARGFAVLGGLVLSSLILLTCLSILGRSLNAVFHGAFFQSTLPDLAAALLATGIGPINGDFELVEAGLAFAIFAFLPLCHLHGAHASVDLFTAKLPEKAKRVLALIIELAFAAVLVLIAVKLSEGMISKRNTGQTTLLLQLPVWWGYAPSLLGAVVAACVGVYVAFMRALEVIQGQALLPRREGAEH